MISTKSAEILSLIENNQTEDILDMETFRFLESKEYISHDGKGRAYVTPQGIEALEDYFHYRKALEREEKTLELSRQSIKKSDIANVISIIALVSSFLISISSLLIS